MSREHNFITDSPLYRSHNFSCIQWLKSFTGNEEGNNHTLAVVTVFKYRLFDLATFVNLE